MAGTQLFKRWRTRGIKCRSRLGRHEHETFNHLPDEVSFQLSFPFRISHQASPFTFITQPFASSTTDSLTHQYKRKHLLSSKRPTTVHSYQPTSATPALSLPPRTNLKNLTNSPLIDTTLAVVTAPLLTFSLPFSSFKMLSFRPFFFFLFLFFFSVGKRRIIPGSSWLIYPLLTPFSKQS